MQTAHQVASLLSLAMFGFSALSLSLAPAVGAPASHKAITKSIQSRAAWALDLAGGNQATLLRAGDGTMTITISSTDSTDYHVRLAEAPISLTEGKFYTVRFRAKASQPRIIKIYSQIDHGDFHGVGLDTPVQLGTQWTDYQFSFKAAGVEPKHVSCPQFLLGSQTGTVQLADVSLKLGALAVVSNPAPPAPHWAYYELTPGLGSIRQEGTAQVVTVTNTDGTAWHVQLNRLGSVLAEGQPVTVTFRAKADAPTDMLVSGQVAGGDYHGIVKDNWESVGTDWKDYSVAVTPHDLGGLPVLFPQFLLGHMPGTVWIDAVTVHADGTAEAAGAADIPTVTPPAPLPQSVLPPELPGDGDIRLEGTIRQTDFADGSFVLLVTRTVEPSGAGQDLSEPRPKTVRLSKATHLGSALLTDPGSVLQAGETVAVIGPNLGAGKVLPAREILTLPRP